MGAYLEWVSSEEGYNSEVLGFTLFWQSTGRQHRIATALKVDTDYVQSKITSDKQRFTYQDTILSSIHDATEEPSFWGFLLLDLALQPGWKVCSQIWKVRWLSLCRGCFSFSSVGCTNLRKRQKFHFSTSYKAVDQEAHVPLSKEGLLRQKFGKYNSWLRSQGVVTPDGKHRFSSCDHPLAWIIVKFIEQQPDNHYIAFVSKVGSLGNLKNVIEIIDN